MSTGTIILSPKQKALLGFSILTLPVLVTFYSKIKKVVGKKALKNFLTFFFSCSMAYSLYNQFNNISILASFGKKVILMRVAVFN